MPEFFSRLSIDGKLHLSDFVFSVLVGFSLYTTSMYHEVKQSPKSTTGMSSVAFLMLQRRKGPELWSTDHWRLHHDNAPAHSSHLIQTYFFWREIRLLLFARLPATSGCSRPKVGYFAYNENPTRALNSTSLKCCLPSTDDNDRREKMHVFE